MAIMLGEGVGLGVYQKCSEFRYFVILSRYSEIVKTVRPEAFRENKPDQVHQTRAVFLTEVYYYWGDVRAIFYCVRFQNP